MNSSSFEKHPPPPASITDLRHCKQDKFLIKKVFINDSWCLLQTMEAPDVLVWGRANEGQQDIEGDKIPEKWCQIQGET